MSTQTSWGAVFCVFAAIGLATWWGQRAVARIEETYRVDRDAAILAVATGAGVAAWEAAGGQAPPGPPWTIRAQVGREALRQTWHLPATLAGLLAAGGVAWVVRRGRWRTSALSGTRWAMWRDLYAAGMIWTTATSTYFTTIGWRGRGAVRIAVPQRRTQLVHIAILGGTRTGKSVSMIIPAALDWRGSLILVAMKPELLKFTRGHRATLGAWWIHDPLDSRTHKFILVAGVESVQDAIRLASELIQLHAETRDPFWVEAARLLLAAAILHVQAEAHPTMGEVWRALTGEPEEVKARLLSSAVKEARELAAQAGLGEPKMGAGILQTVRASLWVWSSPLVDHQTAASDFTIEDLARDEAWTLCLHVRQADVAALRAWYRATLVRIVTGLIDAADRRPRRVPVLVILDELAALGKLNELPTWLETCAGRGICFLLSVQSLAQLDTWGPDVRKRLLDNCGVRIAFRANDLATAEWMSKMTGERVVKTQNRSRGWGTAAIGAGNISHGYSERTAPLLTVAEAQELPRGVAIARVLDLPPLRVRTLPWYRRLAWRALGRLPVPRYPHRRVEGLSGLTISPGPPAPAGPAPGAAPEHGVDLFFDS